eukprot:9085774-Pyramimonas_sp.AAC.1
MRAGTQACIVDAYGHNVGSYSEALVAAAVSDDTGFVEIAIDGSCSKPGLLVLQRAGWAITLLDLQSDVPLRSLFAPVPSTLPQTSAMA